MTFNNTDDIPEGEVNLFHSPERVRKGILEDLDAWELPVYNGHKFIRTGLKLDQGSIDTKLVPIHSSEAHLEGSRNICIDFSLGHNFTLNLPSTVTLTKPKNLKSGAFYTLRILAMQANCDIIYDKCFLFPTGVKPELTGKIGAIDILTFYCDGTYLYGGIMKDFRPCS